jgi:hypothetical protein
MSLRSKWAAGKVRGGRISNSIRNRRATRPPAHFQRNPPGRGLWRRSQAARSQELCDMVARMRKLSSSFFSDLSGPLPPGICPKIRAYSDGLCPQGWQNSGRRFVCVSVCPNRPRPRRRPSSSAVFRVVRAKLPPLAFGWSLPRRGWRTQPGVSTPATPNKNGSPCRGVRSAVVTRGRIL